MWAEVNEKKNSQIYYNLKKEFPEAISRQKKIIATKLREDNEGEDKKKANSGRNSILACSRPGAAL